MLRFGAVSAALAILLSASGSRASPCDDYGRPFDRELKAGMRPGSAKSLSRLIHALSKYPESPTAAGREFGDFAKSNAPVTPTALPALGNYSCQVTRFYLAFTAALSAMREYPVSDQDKKTLRSALWGSVVHGLDAPPLLFTVVVDTDLILKAGEQKLVVFKKKELKALNKIEARCRELRAEHLKGQGELDATEPIRRELLQWVRKMADST